MPVKILIALLAGLVLGACQTERDQIGTVLDGAAPGIRYSTPKPDNLPLLNTAWVGIGQDQGMLQDRFLAAQLVRDAGYPLFQIQRLKVKRWYLTPGDGSQGTPDPDRHDLIAQLNYMRVIPLKEIADHLTIGGRISTIYAVRQALAEPRRRSGMLMVKCSGDRPLC